MSLIKSSEIIFSLRKQNNLNQEHVYEATGISKASLSAYENGNTHPTLDNLVKLAKFFNVSLDYLVFGKETTTPLSAPQLVPRQVDAISARLQERIERQTRLLSFIGQRLEENVKQQLTELSSDYESIIAKPSSLALFEEEIWKIELCSEKTIVGYPNCEDNVTYDSERSEYVPGEFFNLQVENIRGNPEATYEVYFAKNVTDEEVACYRNFIEKYCGAAAVNRFDLFRIDHMFVVQFVLYELDILKLKSTYPVLYSHISEYVFNGCKIAVIVSPQEQTDISLISQGQYSHYTEEYFSYLKENASEV